MWGDPMALLPPIPHLVCKAWLRGVPGLNPDKIGRVRPKDTAAWAKTGFVQIGPTLGPGSGVDNERIPVRRSIFSITCWAVNPDSGRPPVNEASVLAELILADCRSDRGSGGRDVSPQMPSGYRGATVRSAWELGEPRETPGAAESFARVGFDLTIIWIAKP